MERHTIVPVQPDEIHQLYQFILSLAAHQGQPNAVDNSPKQLLEDIRAGWLQAYFLKIEETIIGSCIIYTMYSTWKGRSLFLDELYIIPEYRRKGWGQVLFDFVLDKARNMGCTAVRWYIAPDNEEAIAFYKKNKATIGQYWLNASLTLD